MFGPDFWKELRKVITASVLLGLVCAVNAQAQITATLRSVTVRSAVEFLQKEYQYSFTMSTDQVDINAQVNVEAKNAPLRSVLDQIFAGQNVSYRINGKHITVTSANNAVQARSSKAADSGAEFSGIILDEEKLPMPGAAIMEQGTTNGTNADADGRFHFNTKGSSPTLVISFFGYEDVVLPMKGSKNNLEIRMYPQMQTLDDAVVVGYGTMTRRDITSAIGQFRPKASERRDVLSVDQFLQGRIAGVHISTASGIPGASSRVSIRGIGSLTAGNEPLYVIDGVPLTSTTGDTGAFTQAESLTGLATLNPSDIESVEVLKDAASAAIYGSRATNGVIIITTKSGKKGAPRVTVDASTSWSVQPRTETLEIASPDLMIETFNEAIDNYNMQYGATLPRFENPAPGFPTHDWLKDVLRTGHSRNLTASVSGGTDAIKYYVSGGVKHQEGPAIDNDLDQYSFKTNLSGKIKNWLSFGVNSQFSYTHNNRVSSGYSGFNVVKAAVEQYSWTEPINPDGSWASQTDGVLINNNALQAIKAGDFWLRTYRVLSSANLTFHLLPGLDFKTSLGEDFVSMEEHVYYTSKHRAALPSPDNPLGGMLTDGRRHRTTVLWENTLSYNKKFNSGLGLGAVLGHSVQLDESSSASQTGQGFPSASFDVNASAANITAASTSRTSYALQSYFGRLNLNYKDRYVGTFTMRADGSSKFAPEHRYGYFPSASVGWNVDKEPWWKASGVTLKLRASVGATGNQGGIGAYAYQALAAAGFNYNNVNGLGLSTAGNRDLKWETALQEDFGLDVSFFKGALSITADIFNKDTRDLLYSRPIMATTGYTTLSSNIGSMNNKGLEFTIAGNLGKRDFRWRGDFNISFIRNKLTKLLDDKQFIMPDSFHTLKVGEEVGSFYMVKMIGIYQRDEDVPEYLYTNEGVRAGDVIYEDVSGPDGVPDGKIDNTYDRQIVGSANPKFSGGFNNTFTWKNLELSVFMTYSYGQSVYEYWSGGLRLAGSGLWPQLRSVCEGRWTGEGTTNTTPRAIYNQTWNSTKFGTSSRFLHDASYLRIRSITLGYNLPNRWVSALKLDGLRIYCQLDNAWVFTKWPYLDPEVSYNSSATTYGVDWLNPGQPRTFMVGINLKF